MDMDDLAARTDSYFLKTKAIVGQFGDKPATYAVFMRRPVISAPRFAVEFLESMAAARGTRFDIELNHPEGAWVGAGEPILYVTGPLFHLVDLETVLLQKLGPACVAAYNASAMCADLPKVAFLAMDARHCAGAEMAEMMAYAASVGSAHARQGGRRGRLCRLRRRRDRAIFRPGHGHGHDAACADRLCRLDRARRRDVSRDLPGRAADRAGRLFRPRDQRCGRGVPPLSRACRRGPASPSAWTRRADATARGSTSAGSYEVLERHAPQSIRGYRTEAELRYLVGTGVTAAALWQMRQVLDEAGFPKARIVASSGFGPEKCRMMAAADAPIDVIGTGSYLPDLWTETYATADIIAYDGQPMVKAGREFLLRGSADRRGR